MAEYYQNEIERALYAQLEESKKLLQAFHALKENDERAARDDIARALSSEYYDFEEARNDAPDAFLCEIYRTKIENIFIILAQKGIVIK